MILKSKALEVSGLAVFLAGMLLALGAALYIGINKPWGGERTVATESMILGWFLMMAGIGFPLAFVGTDRRLSVLGLSVLLAGFCIGMGVLAVPKFARLPSDTLSLMYNFGIPFALWMLLLGIGIVVWTLKRELPREELVTEA